MTVFASPELTNVQQTLHSLAEKVQKLDGLLTAVLDRLTDVEHITLNHESRLDELEAPHPKSKPRDDTNERILTYLREEVPGRWQTPGTIAANLDLENTSVADRLFRMARNGNCGLQVRGGKGTGQHPLYRITPEPVPPQPEA
jgi:hypothetical protein